MDTLTQQLEGLAGEIQSVLAENVRDPQHTNDRLGMLADDLLNMAATLCQIAPQRADTQGDVLRAVGMPPYRVETKS